MTIKMVQTRISKAVYALDILGPNIVWLAPADMARLPPSIIKTNIFLLVNNLVCQLGLHLL
jgi:hypothetical protein